jgi:hypothetical protein
MYRMGVELNNSHAGVTAHRLRKTLPWKWRHYERERLCGNGFLLVRS